MFLVANALNPMKLVHELIVGATQVAKCVEVGIPALLVILLFSQVRVPNGFLDMSSLHVFGYGSTIPPMPGLSKRDSTPPALRLY